MNKRLQQLIDKGAIPTSVQKDALVAEPNVIDKPNILEFRNFISLGEQNDSYNRVWKTDNYCGALNCTKQMEILEPQDTAEPLRIPQATKQGYIEVTKGAVFDMSYPESTTRRGRVQEGGQVSPTLMAGGETPCYFEGYKAPHCVWKTVVGSKQANSFLGDVNGEAPCITSACGAGGGMTPMVTNAPLKEANTDEFREQVRGHSQLQYRIRKLTPRECFRLMGVSETNIDKIQQSGVSQSQQYKMAGNSIVVDVLYHLMRKMFIEKQNESQQLTLF